MKRWLWLCMAAALLLLGDGCGVTGQSIARVNQRIEKKYSSFSTARYSYTESTYQDGVLVGKTGYTESIKRPDKLRQAINQSPAGRTDGYIVSTVDGNTSYQRSGVNTIDVYEWVNLPTGMSSYGAYLVTRSLDKWQIPLEMADETKYRVQTSEETYDGRKAIKAVVTVLMSEEAKQKQLAIGRTPLERVVTYWFDAGTLAILKEETFSSGTISHVSQTMGGPTTT